jgi:hypothetical protein
MVINYMRNLLMEGAARIVMKVSLFATGAHLSTFSGVHAGV